MSIDGVYAAYLAGRNGEGFALFLLSQGIVAGADPSGSSFDGSYTLDESGRVLLQLNVQVPPHGVTINGEQTGETGLRYKLEFALPADFVAQNYVTVETPFGPINARLVKVRGPLS